MKIFFVSFFTFFLSAYCLADDSHWDINARFEALDLGNKALGSGAFWGGAGQSEIVTKPELSGQSAKIWIYNNQTGYGKWGGEWKFPSPLKKGDKVWFSVHTYFPEDFDHYSYGEGGRLKFLRIATKSSDMKGHGHNDLYINTKGDYSPFRYIYEGEQKWVNVGKREDLIEKNKWENYQMAITFDSKSKDDGGTAEILIWKNGKRLAHITNRKTLKTETDLATRARLFTYWNGGGPQQQSMYVDEIRITNSEPEWVDSEGYPLIPFFTDLCRLPKI